MSSNKIRAFSERLMPPYSGQVQVAESGTYRALTIDGQVWEVQYVNRSHVRVATLKASEIKARAISPELLEGGTMDEELLGLLDYLADVELPFAATDVYEYWLLDAQDHSPLALIFSCSEAAQMAKFPAHDEWTALPAAVMPIKKTDDEERAQSPPVNYRLERLVAQRAGTRPKAHWFNRLELDGDSFPPLLVREDWTDAADSALCSRYIERQAPRLLMLHGLSQDSRRRLEACARAHAMEVARFCGLYPELIDAELIQALRVEARFRAAHDRDGQLTVQHRRDGVLYI